MGNSFIAINRSIKATGVLGQVSFNTFKEAIQTSANALGIAANKGEAFTNKMTKDLTALSALATSLSIGISSLNEKFEEAGSLISSPDSPFRVLLAVSGGAGINQMLSNQFDKTEAMLKAVTYLQGLNKSFGNNLQITAQIAQQSLGVSKNEAIKLINMRQESIDAIRKAQQDIAGLQTNATRDAYEKVNSGIMDTWARVKTMFSTFFSRAFGSSEGMGRFIAKLEDFINNLKNKLENSDWIKRLSNVIDKIADWIGDKLTGILTWIDKAMQEFMDPNTNVITKILEHITNALMLPMFLLGQMLGKGAWSVMFGRDGEEEKKKMISEYGGGSGNNTNPMLAQINNPLQQQLSANQARQNELTKQSDALDKYSPEAITYGRDATGNVGFMSVGQKQFAAEEEKRILAEKAMKLQQDIADNTKIADATDRKSGTPNATPSSLSPVGSAGLKIGMSAATYGLSDLF
jgi:hypothetical protein